MLDLETRGVGGKDDKTFFKRAGSYFFPQKNPRKKPGAFLF